jgi:radical SAM superfamily enzyme YgiQ (UPF0313 family)
MDQVKAIPEKKIILETELINGRKNFIRKSEEIHVGKQRAQIGSSKSIIPNLDHLPLIDRSLIDQTKYSKYVGHAGRKNFMAVQATRGCPYKCFYCDIYKTTVIHYRKSVDHIFEECMMISDLGIKRIEFIDDIFNVNVKHASAFFKKIINSKRKFEFWFPTGLKGDLLTKELIDLMVEGGTTGMNLSLEHPSPRLQKVMRKNLDVDKFKENCEYIAAKYPQVVTGLNTMHGFPTETEEEAYMTLNFIRDIKWAHFPYMFNVRVFPGTEIEHFAIESGVPKHVIEETQDMSYEEGSPTIPFSRDFTKAIKTIFLRDYVLNKERLLHVLPFQMQQYTEDELDQKYNGYFPSKINSFNDLLKVARIDRSELSVTECRSEEDIKVPEISTKLQEFFPKKQIDQDALKVMLVDLSTYYIKEDDNREYNVVEPPLGLMSLVSFINNHSKLSQKVNFKILKSFIDFNSHEELVEKINEFSPDLLGFRTMTFYRTFFHEAIDVIRKANITTPIIVGGPYPTASHVEVLEDKNIDLAVIAEGEITFSEILDEMIKNNKKFPSKEVLATIDGIAFRNN